MKETMAKNGIYLCLCFLSNCSYHYDVTKAFPHFCFDLFIHNLVIKSQYFAAPSHHITNT